MVYTTGMESRGECRYGTRCTRINCAYAHGGVYSEPEYVSWIGITVPVCSVDECADRMCRRAHRASHPGARVLNRQYCAAGCRHGCRGMVTRDGMRVPCEFNHKKTCAAYTTWHVDGAVCPCVVASTTQVSTTQVSTQQASRETSIDM